MPKTRLAFVGLLTVLAVSTVVTASASASGPYVYAKSGSFPLMGVLELQIAQVGSATLEGVLAGIKVKISCEKSEAESASLENVLTAGIEHTLGSTVNHETKCTVIRPAVGNCKLRKELILISAHNLAITGPSLKFTAASSTSPTTVVIENCNSEVEIDGTYPLEGFALATPNNTDSTWEFTSTSGSSLLLAGNSAKFIANYKVEMKGGGELEIK